MMRIAGTTLIAAFAVALASWVVWQQHPLSATGLSTGLSAQQGPSAYARASWILDFEEGSPTAAWWPSRGVFVIRSNKHTTHGRTCARVDYDAGDSPAWIIGEGPNEAGLPRNWQAYEALELDLYNPQGTSERLIIQLKDAGGRLYKEDIILQPQKGQTVHIRLAEVSPFIDIAAIRHLNLFRWHPTAQSRFYVDAIRLLPKSAVKRQETVSPETPPVLSDRWRLAWTSGTEKVLRNPAAFRGSTMLPMNLELAAGETESVQLVVIGGRYPARITATASSFANAKGEQLPPESITMRVVGYVRTNQPYYPATFVGDWPDPLLAANTTTVAAGELQPIWFSVTAPPAASAGWYSGTITLADDRGRTEQARLIIHIWDFTLPKASHLKTAFDFYPQHLRRAYQEIVPGGGIWRGRMAQLQQRYLEDLISHRLMPILNIDPLDESEIKQLNHYRQSGLSVFGVGAYGGAFDNNWPQNNEALAKLIPTYADYARKLKEAGLLEDAYVYAYDEPKLNDPQVPEVLAALRGAAAGLKRLLVMYDAPDPTFAVPWLKDVDILCLRISSFDWDSAKRWAAQGKEIWLYTSSPAHPYPSLVIDAPLLAPRLLAWMCWKYQVKGLLYWCVNFWSGNPWKNPATFRPDQNGNGFLYYPGISGPVPSMRLEALRDGLEDYEYLYRLRQLADGAKAAGNPDPALVARAERLLSIDPRLVSSLREYAQDAAILMENRRAIAETIEQLQRLLPSSDGADK